MAIYNKFNRGEVDPLALSRDDVSKINNSCETMLNFLPLRLGPYSHSSVHKQPGADLDR